MCKQTTRSDLNISTYFLFNIVQREGGYDIVSYDYILYQNISDITFSSRLSVISLWQIVYYDQTGRESQMSTRIFAIK